MNVECEVGMGVGEHEAKAALFDGFAQVAKALSTGRRVELIDVLEQGERHVEELAAAIDQSVANTSFHLRALAAAGLVRTRRDGNRVHYRLASPQVAALWSALRDVAIAHHDEIDALAVDYLGDRSGFEPIGRAELARRLDDGDVLVIDVRPEPEYAAGHIAGARCIPLDDLDRHLAELPDDLEVVAYCRGPFCVYADDAARRLTAAGRLARRLEDGFPQWRNAGLPVAVGAGVGGR
ncbi:MAG: metalloregulator ArsR/SmtB family transcription factor [Acidimicrobiales bacterium]|nr:metalloregulator ArsR/SmtB family transcription factor [Acidimicrobiales bacterium]